ncbi:MAG: 4Fe-4S dicluster domain-containing protein [Clostridia bacterium]|nr:4Fe-4S dicluster domain-containing protein [Clostridia bacterium]
MAAYYHSIVLDEKLCMGCTNCIKRCPTEAIRVHDGKARIFNEKCIDCGECVRTCPYHAKVAQTDSLDIMANYKYTIALPAPTLYMQYDLKFTRQHVVTALKMLGFDAVYEVARGAEIVTAVTDQYMEEHRENLPLISSACPAVVRLLQARFPSLLPRLLPIKSPMEISAMNARKEFCQQNPGVKSSEVGVFFISPCAAKMTGVRNPIELKKSNVNGVFSIKSVYFKLLKQMSKLKEPEDLLKAGYKGVRWASIGGEARALKTQNVLSVDGIQNVVRIFEQLEDDKLDDVDFIEACACTGGCLGGPLTVENLYVARNRQRQHRDTTPTILEPVAPEEMENCMFETYPQYLDVTTLDADRTEAIKKLRRMNEICEELPKLDCGACGAPSCRALSEDIVRGKANVTDCVFVLRQKVRDLAREMMILEGLMPSDSSKEKENEE